MVFVSPVKHSGSQGSICLMSVYLSGSHTFLVVTRTMFRRQHMHFLECRHFGTHPLIGWQFEVDNLTRRVLLFLVLCRSNQHLPGTKENDFCSSSVCQTMCVTPYFISKLY